MLYIRSWVFVLQWSSKTITLRWVSIDQYSHSVDWWSSLRIPRLGLLFTAYYSTSGSLLHFPPSPLLSLQQGRPLFAVNSQAAYAMKVVSAGLCIRASNSAISCWYRVLYYQREVTWRLFSKGLQWVRAINLQRFAPHVAETAVS